MEKIELRDFNVISSCDLFRHGTVVDNLAFNNFEFHVGKFYGIVGEFGDGGEALSYGMAGKADICKGEVYVDDRKSSLEFLFQNSWYIGSDLKVPKWYPKKKKTIKWQIAYGARKFKQEHDADTIQRLFRVSDERVNRNINFVSGERWKASAAIGFANGRRIFCYPWMNTRDVRLLKEQMAGTIEFLLASKCIVILPTTTERNVEAVFPEHEIISLRTVLD